MRKLLLLGVVLGAATLGGCKKAASTAPPTGSSTPAGAVSTVAPGSGGAVQAVRQAAVRAVNLQDLNQIRLFIDTASLAGGKMPSAEETFAALQKEAPAIAKQVQERRIILTGVANREGIWAYTAEPQSQAGEHLVVTSSSTERMPAATLQERLKAQ